MHSRQKAPLRHGRSAEKRLYQKRPEPPAHAARRARGGEKNSAPEHFRSTVSVVGAADCIYDTKKINGEKTKTPTQSSMGVIVETGTARWSE